MFGYGDDDDNNDEDDKNNLVLLQVLHTCSKMLTRASQSRKAIYNIKLCLVGPD